MHSKNDKMYFFLVLTAVLWGGNPVAVKSVLGEITPIMTVLIRYIGISAILLSIMFIKEGRHALPPKHQILPLILMGITGIVLNNGLQFIGLQYSTVVNCSLVAATTPAITAILAVLFLKETMNKKQWLGIFISLLGVVYLVAHGSMEIIKNLSFNKGDLLFLVSQASWAVYTLLGRRVMEDVSPMGVTAWAGFSGAIFMGIAALYEGVAAPSRLSYDTLLSLSYMIIGSGILAMNWWNTGVRVVGANRAAIFTNIIPLAAMALSVVLLHEHVGWHEIAGGIWIIFGVYLTTKKTRAVRTA
ncbi:MULTISPECIES: DMT family transporter [Sporomusa]|jgi:drug/metabolite transporter (DMT)-like permease|uniref:DMT family transporter n=1 Tax=Sporomusa TaxID=2375 RepID=UPI00166AF63A|nr:MULTISPECIES: DMT family transporter [Sporomusa]MCM0760412.1 DMT family transporter [Sporomusa sphaeroides DSM 2875]